MVLGTEHAAAERRLEDMSAFGANLDAAKALANKHGLSDLASSLDAMICAAQVVCQDAQAVIEAFQRQENERVQTRARSMVRRNFDQLMLQPQAVL